jgi:chromosome segregation ATPase
MSISLTEAREGMKSVMDKQAQIQTRAFSLERDKRGAEASVDKLRTELDAERQRNSKLDSVWRRKCDKLERDIEHMKVAVQITPAARDATVASADDLIREVHDLEREIRMIKSHRDELAQELSVKEAEIDDLKHCIREILSWAKIVKDEHQQFKTFVVETLRCGKEGIDSVSEHILPPFRTLQQSLHSHAEIVVADCQRLSGDLLSLESEVSGLRGREAELNRELSFVKSRLDKSEEQLRKKSKECSTLQARFEEVESAKKVDDEKIVRLQSLVSRLQAQAQKDAAREKAKEKDKSREEAVSLYASTMHDLSNKENEELRVAYMAEHTRLQRCLSTMSQKEKIITSQQEQIRTLEANLEKARKECDLRRSTSIRTEASTTSLQKKCADLESARQAENEALREHQRMTKALCAEVERLMDDLSKERDMVRILNAEKADLETRLDDMQLHVEALQVQLQAAEMACKASASPKVKKTSSVAQSNAVSKTTTRPRSGYST